MGPARRRSDDPVDLPATESVLKALAATPRPLTALDLARATALSTLTVIPVLERLARQGSVIRSLSPAAPTRQQGWIYHLAPTRRGRAPAGPGRDRPAR